MILKSPFKACLFGGVFLFFLWSFYSAAYPPLPSEKDPLLFYSNQTSDDLRVVLRRVIQKTKKSLFIQIYGCTDLDLLHELKKAAARGVAIKLFYDPSGSGALAKKLPFATPLSCQGLMHKKILISDEATVFIGSANFTPTSLRMHDNLTVGLYQKDLASFIVSSTEQQFSFVLKDQLFEFWHLPDSEHRCLQSILKAIHEAKTSIHLALFTFTHPRIVEALIDAKQRGVELHIALDSHSAQGASKKAIASLRSQEIFPLLGKGDKLLHHKWALIDQSTLLLGSANWTESAFRQNEDCLLIVRSLNLQQKKYFGRIWKEIERNSRG